MNEKYKSSPTGWKQETPDLDQKSVVDKKMEISSMDDEFYSQGTSDFYMTNTKLAHTFVNQPLKKLVDIETNFDVNIGGAVITASIEVDKALVLSGTYEFDDYDKAIHDAICTLGEAGNVFFTVDMVYRTMYNYTAERRASNSIQIKIKKSINKMQNITLRADLTAHLKQKKTTLKDNQMVIKDRLLSLREYTGSLNGTTVEGYRFNGTPILYDYSKAVNQLITIPAKLLDPKIATVEKTVIRTYLFTRIASMKHAGSKQSKTILYSSVLKRVEQAKGKELTSKNKLSSKATIKELLDFFMQSGFIEDYTEDRDGRNKKGKAIITV